MLVLNKDQLVECGADFVASIALLCVSLGSSIAFYYFGRNSSFFKRLLFATICIKLVFSLTLVIAYEHTTNNQRVVLWTIERYTDVAYASVFFFYGSFCVRTHFESIDLLMHVFAATAPAALLIQQHVNICKDETTFHLTSFLIFEAALMVLTCCEVGDFLFFASMAISYELGVFFSISVLLWTQSAVSLFYAAWTVHCENAKQKDKAENESEIQDVDDELYNNTIVL